MSYSHYQVISEQGVLLSSARRPTRTAAREVSRKELLVAQSELKPLLIDAVLHRTGRRRAPCQFRLDLAQVGDVVFHAEWAGHSDRIVEVPEPLCQFRQHRTGATRTNIRNLEAWVADEWTAMRVISDMIQEPAWARWIRRQKLRCLFAARAHVKIQGMRRFHPEYARDIRRLARGLVGEAPWILGLGAVLGRDAMCRMLGLKRRNPLTP